MDLLELMFDKVAAFREGAVHSYFGHPHLHDPDPGSAQQGLRAQINALLARNRMAFEMTEEGQVVRLGPPVIRETLAVATFDTDDADLNHLLNRARDKFRSPDVAMRRESLEQLWDAYERLKSASVPTNKKQSIAELIAGTGLNSEFQSRLDAEMRALTDIGNHFRIRHAEVGKLPIESSAQVDYLFARLFAAIWLLLRRSTKRAADPPQG